MQLNPDLALERTWDLDAVLEHKVVPQFALSLGGFDKEVRELTVFEETDGDILSWTPSSRESARIFGFRGGLEMVLLDGLLEGSLEYIHEEHDQDITYRPKDRGRLNVTLLAPLEIELSLSGDFYGIRYTALDESGDGISEESLSSYFLLKPRISRAFGKYASVFLMGAFCIGDDDHQIWEGYGLPDQTIDFGLTLKF